MSTETLPKGVHAAAEGEVIISLTGQAAARLAAEALTAQIAAKKLRVQGVDGALPEGICRLVASAIASRIFGDGAIGWSTTGELQQALVDEGVSESLARLVTDTLATTRHVVPADEALGSFGVACAITPRLSDLLDWRP